MPRAAVAERDKLTGLIAEIEAQDEEARAGDAVFDALRAADAEAFGEPEAPRPALVTAYGPDGEVRDFEVSHLTAPNDVPTITTSTAQPVMPGFEGLTADKVVLNLSGRVELNLENPAHQALWEKLRWGTRIGDLRVAGVVVDRKHHLSLDKGGHDKERTEGASLKVSDVYLPEPALAEHVAKETWAAEDGDDLHAASMKYNLSDALADAAAFVGDDTNEGEAE